MKEINLNTISSLQNSIFKLNSKEFEKAAIQLFHFQYQTNNIYKKFCKLIDCDPKHVKKLKNIPFLPISSFKKHLVKSTDFEAEVIFSSSGTTDSTSSQHHLKSLSLYEKSFITHFESIYGKAEDYCFLALLPSYLERSGSSLIYMVEKLIQKSKFKESGFFLHDYASLNQSLQGLGKRKIKTILIGVSFALIDFITEFNSIKNSQLIVMETGGMKGRKKEIVREELHQLLNSGFPDSEIHSEYGMTELLSQAYAVENGKFRAPNWMKVLIRKHDDPFSFCQDGEVGGINIIDLANIYSTAFIQTDDLGRKYNDGTFEVLGRFDTAELRGCNLLVH